MNEILPDILRHVRLMSAEIASSNLSLADKTFLERLTMQGNASNWNDSDKRKYMRIANQFVNPK